MNNTIKIKITQETIGECSNEAWKISTALTAVGYQFQRAEARELIGYNMIELTLVKETL